MDIKVQLNNIRIAPRKSRQVVDLIRGKDAAQARALLEFTIKRPADPVLKLLKSALASAKNDFKLQETNLYVSKITVDEGPKLKRSFPMSRGRAYPIMKRTSHIVLVLSEKVSKVKEEKATEKVVKKEKIQKAKVKMQNDPLRSRFSEASNAKLKSKKRVKRAS